MANVYLPPPYPRRILEDLARAIAFAEKSQITIRYDGPGHLDTSTWATDRRLYPPTATGSPPPSEPDEKESGGVGGTPVEPLPELPKPEALFQVGSFGRWREVSEHDGPSTPLFNANQMRDYARAALHQSETPTSSLTSEPAQAGAVRRPVDGDRE